MPSALTDDQVSGEISKMVEFINKEAEEKAKEITIKADEEYEAEKSALVRSETAAIDQEYSAKYKQAKLAEQIVKSTVTSKSRLKVLQAKEEIVDKLVEDTKQKISKIPSDAGKYEKLLIGLIQEGVDLLKEKEVVITARKADKDIATKAAKAIKDCKVTVADKELTDSTYGGVIIATTDNKLTIDNTLETRLSLLVTKSLPLIRLELFGPSKDRRFFD